MSHKKVLGLHNNELMALNLFSCQAIFCLYMYPILYTVCKCIFFIVNAIVAC